MHVNDKKPTASNVTLYSHYLKLLAFHVLYPCHLSLNLFLDDGDNDFSVNSKT